MKKTKYLLLFEDDLDNAKIKRAQRSLGQELTSSGDLGSDLRAQNVYDEGAGVLFKHLKVAVVENIEEDRLAKALRSSTNPIIHYEPEQIFRPVQEIELLEELKNTLSLLQSQVNDLEELLRTREKDERPAGPMTWGIRAIGGDRQTTTGAGVKVAVLDSGLLVSHPNFSGREIMGKSFVPDQDWELDKLGHGTHCAGTICGSKSSENGLRFGVAPDVDLMVGKVLNDDGDGKGSWIIDGIDWAIEKGARVISLSLGGPTQIGQSPSPIYERIGRRALRNNCLMIAAAGNHSKRPRKMPRPVSAPANCESIMAIAAVDRDLKVASFSNAGLNAQDGGRIDLAAPGVDVYSSHTFSGPGEDHYEVMDGTSMATPHVAGVAALYLEKFPNLSATELWLKLEKNARELSNQKFRDVGNGLVTII